MNSEDSNNTKGSVTSNIVTNSADAPGFHEKYSNVSEFRVPKMDCMSEERLVRMALETVSSDVLLQFDIPQRIMRMKLKQK